MLPPIRKNEHNCRLQFASEIMKMDAAPVFCFLHLFLVLNT